MIVGLLLAGLGLFLAFWLLDKVVAVWITGRKFQYSFQRWVQLVRVLVWSVFGLYALYSFLQVDYLVSLAILAFLLIAGLDFCAMLLREFFFNWREDFRRGYDKDSLSRRKSYQSSFNTY